MWRCLYADEESMALPQTVEIKAVEQNDYDSSVEKG